MEYDGSTITAIDKVPGDKTKARIYLADGRKLVVNTSELPFFNAHVAPKARTAKKRGRRRISKRSPKFTWQPPGTFKRESTWRRRFKRRD